MMAIKGDSVARKKFIFYLGAGATSPFMRAGGKQVDTSSLTRELLSEEAWRRIFDEIGKFKSLHERSYWAYNFNLKHTDVVGLIKAISEKNKFVLPSEIAAIRGSADIPICGVDFNFEHVIYFLDKICAFLDDGSKADLDTLFYDVDWMNGSQNSEYRQQKKGWFKVPTLARELIIRYILDVWADISDENKKQLIESNKVFIKNCMTVADVDIYTLNYDPVIYEAVKNLGINTGFSKIDIEGISKFSGENYLKASDALSFLHGFAGFFPRSDGKQVVLNEDYMSVANERLRALFVEGELGYDLKICTPTRKAYCRDTVIVTGLDKYAAFYSVPFSTYLYRFSESLKQSDVIVIMGASLDDEHINLFLKNALFSGSKKIVCVNYIPKDELGVSWEGLLGNVKSPALKFWVQFPQSTMAFPMGSFTNDVLTESFEQKHRNLIDHGYCKLTNNLLFYCNGTKQFLNEGMGIINQFL